MRVLEHFNEAFWNVAAGVSKAGMLTCLTTVLISACAIIDSATAHHIENEAKAFRTSGAAVRILRAPGLVDGAACDRLAELPGIEAAGAVRKEPETLTSAALPRQQIPVYEVSPRFGEFPSVPGFRSGSGMAVSLDLAAMLGVHAHEEASVVGGRSVRISSVFSWADDGRVGGFGYAFIGASAPTKPFDECWISLYPGAPAFADAHASTLVIQSRARADSPNLYQLNSTLGSAGPDAQQWAMRASRWLPLFAFASMALIVYAALFWRRLELATAQHVGIKRASLIAILLIEMALWYVPAILTSIAVVLVFSQQTGSNVSAVWWRSACAGAVGLAASSAVSVFQSSEKRLFRIFKGR